MQLRSRCAGGLRVGGSRLPSRAGRRAVQPQATAKQSKTDVRAARMARILRQYEAAGVDKQQEELSAYVDEREARRGDPEEEGSTRALRASAGHRATDERDQVRLDVYLPLQADGTRLHNAGLHGKGEECWWAIRIKAGREKQVCEAVERMPAIVGPLAPKEEGGQPRPRNLQTWAPKKTQKVWNPKTGKMGNKVIKYPSRYPEMLVSNTNGGLVFVRAEMDKALFDRIAMNPSFIAWDQVETFTTWDATGMPTAYLYPKPSTPKQLAEAKDWEADLEPVEEAVVRAALDLPVPRPVPTTSWEEEAPRGRRGRESRDGRDSRDSRERRFEDRRERPEGRGRSDRFERGEGRERLEDGGERRGRRFDSAAEPAEGGSWYDGGRGSSTRERQGTGLYSAAEGGQRAPWQERGERRERRDRDSGGWEDRRRGREGGSWEDRRGSREGGSREGAGWEDRRDSRESGSWEERPRRERREDSGGRWGDDRPGRQQGRWEDRRSGNDAPQRRSRDGWRDRAAEPARGGSWYDGGASSAYSSSEDEAAGTAGGWFDASSPSEGAASDDQGAFSGWFDSAAAAFDFESGGSEGAASGSSAASQSASGGWSWEAAMQPQQSAAGGAAPTPSAAPADAAGVWEEPVGGLDLWGGAADVTAFGVPMQQGERRGQREQRGPRDDRSRRSFDGGDRRRDRDGSSRFGDRGASGRFGDRGAGGRFGDRGAGGRFGDRERRSGLEGGWEGGRERRNPGDSAPARSADLSWWDGDSQQDGDQFAGVFSPDSDWLAPSQDERSGERSRRRRDGDSDWRDDNRRSDSSAGEAASSGSSGSSGSSSAAFQPGQEISVVSGSFADFDGKVVAAAGGRVTAELDIFGKKTQVELSPTDVAPSTGGSDGASGGSEE